MVQAAFVAALATIFGDYRPCARYFGPLEAHTWNSSTLTTIVDVDVFVGFPRGDQTFVHHAGPTSACVRPTPPVGCHRYYVAQYVGCTAPCALSTGNVTALAGRMDTTGAFDRANGVLQSCASCLHGVSLYCLGPSSPLPEYRDQPISCACPGTTRAQGSNVGAGGGASRAAFVGGIGAGVCTALLGAAALNWKRKSARSTRSDSSRQTMGQIALLHDAAGAVDGASSSKINGYGTSSLPAATATQKVSTRL